MKRRAFITLLGGAAAWPLATRAQQPAMPIIGFLDARSPDAISERLRAYRQGLKEGGYIEGENVAIVYRFAENLAKASNDTELDAGFAALLREGVGGLLVASDPYFDTRRRRIIAFAEQNRLPAIYQFRQYAVEGGLISYGPSITDAYRQVGIYAARILKGAAPADLPVIQPTKFDFLINLKTAKILGLEIPPTVSARADEVIE